MDVNILNISVFTCLTFIELNFYLKIIKSKIYLQKNRIKKIVP